MAKTRSWAALPSPWQVGQHAVKHMLVAKHSWGSPGGGATPQYARTQVTARRAGREAA